MAALISGKPGICIFIWAAVEDSWRILKIVEEAYLPIKHFRQPIWTAIRRLRSGLWNWADGQIFTAGAIKTDELYDVIQKAGIEHLTVSSDSNGSIPVWNEARDQVVAVKVGGMDPLYEIIRNLVVDFNVPMETAIQLITSNVARALELYPEKGTVRPGSHADMVLLDENLHIDTVMAMGKLMMKDKQLFGERGF